MIFNKKKALKEERTNISKIIEEIRKEVDLLKSQNLQLKKENEELRSLVEETNNANNEAVNNKNAELVANAHLKAEKIVLNATKQAELIKEEAKKKYLAEISRLKDFVLRYQANLPDPKERTVNSRKRSALCLLLSDILNDNPVCYNMEESVKLLDKLDKAIGGEGNGNESGFSMDEVLNPSEELDLASLCKELGVME